MVESTVRIMKTSSFATAIAAVVLASLSVSACAANIPQSTGPSNSVATDPSSDAEAADVGTVAVAVDHADPAERAEAYLATAAYSRQGLIDQLVVDGVDEQLAVAAVDSLGVDWVAESERKATELLELLPFSRAGLIEQLMAAGFTRVEAMRGADAVGY